MLTDRDRHSLQIVSLVQPDGGFSLNPLTVLGLVETMRRDGHTALQLPAVQAYARRATGAKYLILPERR